MPWNCIHFGGCYGYNLHDILSEFIQYHYYFTILRNQLPLDTFTNHYISFIQEHYDPSIEYQPQENKKLMLDLIKHYNKNKKTRTPKIELEGEMIVNLRWK